MIACLLIPGFELRAALRKQPGLALRPAALSPVAGTEPLLGPVTAAAAQRRFAALAAANVARPGQILVVSDERLRDFLAPLPLELVPMEPRRRAELHELGVKRVGQLAGLPGGAVAERLGPDGRHAWGLARGGKAARVRGRRPPLGILGAAEVPAPACNALTVCR